MQKTSEVLKLCILFRNLSDNDVVNILNTTNYKVSSFSKGQIVATEDDVCSSIGIILEGSAEIRKIYESGKLVTINRLKPGEIFGEVIIFSSMNKYPSTVVSTGETQIMFIHREEILKACKTNTKLLTNIMELLSNKILTLNKKLKSLSYHTLRQKIASFLLEEYKKQGSLNIALDCTRTEMAEQLGIPRPSLSRELINMREDGLITFKGRSIKILDLISLEDTLFD